MGENGKYYRKVDRFGRIVLPNDIRKNMGIKTGTIVEVSQEDNKMTVCPDEIVCILCGSDQNIELIKNIPFCDECRKRQNRNRADEKN